MVYKNPEPEKRPPRYLPDARYTDVLAEIEDDVIESTVASAPHKAPEPSGLDLGMPKGRVTLAPASEFWAGMRFYEGYNVEMFFNAFGAVFFLTVFGLMSAYVWSKCKVCAF